MRIHRVRMVLGALMFAVTLCLSAVPPMASAAADTCTWTGAVNGNWSNGGNWSGCDNAGVPEAGDSLVFSSGASNMSMTNNLNLTFNEITFNNGGSYTVAGNAVSVSSALNIYGAVTFNSAVNFTASSGNTVLSYQDPSAVLPSTIALNLSGTANFQLFSTVSSLPMPTFNGSVNQFLIVGSASGGQRSFIAASDSTFTAAGGVTIARATVLCESNNCLGASNNAVSVVNGNSRGAELNLWTNNLTVPYDISLNSNGFDGPPTLAVAGNGATLTGSLNVVTDAELDLSGSHVTTLSGTGKTITIGSGATLAVVGATYNDQAVFVNPVAGSGVLNVVTSTVLASGNSSSFDGRIVIDDGGVYKGDSATLGTTTGDIAVNSGGTWVLTNTTDQTISDGVTISGNGGTYTPAALVVSDHSVEFGGMVSVGTASTIDNTSTTGAQVTFSANVVGAGALTLKHSSGNAADAFHFTNSSDNSYSGGTTVNGTKAVLSGGTLAMPGSVNIQATSTSAASVSVLAATVLSDTATITTANTGSYKASLLLNTPATTLGMITGDGEIGFLSTGQNLQVGNGNASGTFSGTFSGSGNTITKIGTGTWTLTDASFAGGSDSASFVINGGTVSFGGSLAGAAITLASGTTLKGTGTVGAVTAQSDSTVSIGNSPGCLTMSSLSLASGTVYQQQIAGAAACSGYDQATISGTAALNNATLQVDLSYTPTASTTFTIMNAGSVTGTFNGLPDGATIVSNGVTLRINYTSTSVTLSYVSGATGGSLADTGMNQPALLNFALAGISVGIALCARRLGAKLCQ